MKAKEKPPKKKTGRPSKFSEEMLSQAEKLTKLGATDKELADFFEVAESTLNLWKREHPEFSESIKRGKSLADANVAERLYQRAMGYSHDAVKIVADAKSKEEHVVHYTEHYPPDTTAAIFWLKNRQPEKWRDKIQQEHSGDLNVTHHSEPVSETLGWLTQALGEGSDGKAKKPLSH